MRKPLLYSSLVAATLAMAAESADRVPVAETLVVGTPVADTKVRTGRIQQWMVTDDGSVQFQLSGVHDPRGKEKAFELWIETPSSQTATTELENLVLKIVLDFSGEDAKPISVGFEASEDEDGASPERAVAMRWIGQRRGTK